EYTSMAVCKSICTQIEPGTSTDMNKDTIGCRAQHAKTANVEPVTECPIAGPLGGGVCTNTGACTTFCVLDLALCAGATAPDGGPNAPYKSTQECATACAGFKVDQGVGDIQEQSGDTFNCRLYHLEAAYGGGALVNVHCPHTAPVSAVCF